VVPKGPQWTKVAEELQSAVTTPIDPPLGFLTARVDEKGRLKLPVDLRVYLASFGSKRVFVTSLDNRTVRIYPVPVWLDNLKSLKEFKKDPKAAADVVFVANANGATSDMDDQGRVLVPQDLRRKLGIENATVWLDCFKNRVNVFGKDVFEQRHQSAVMGLDDKVEMLEKEGCC
jgi:MraZ protein